MTALLNASGVSIPGRLQASSLTLNAGEMVALIGPNGGGKTSLLRAIAGAEEASGSVRIAGERLTAVGSRRSRLLGFMSSSREIGWEIPVADAIALGTGPISAERLGELFERFDLGPLADRPVTRLSTGERSRVLMARAVAGAPLVLLLDEPLSNLDPYWVLQFLGAMRERAEEGGCVLCALHDLSLLPRFDRAVLVSDGAIQADAAASLIQDHPRFGAIFRVQPDERGGWEVRPPEGRRSSP